MSLPSELAALTGPGNDQGLRAMVRRVSALNDSGTVNLDMGAPLTEVPCASGYPYRAVGDLVLVLRLPSSAWLVLAKVGTTAETPVEIPDIPPAVTLSWGDSAPGAGWTTGSTVYVQDNGGGARSIYVQTATTAPTGSTATPAPVSVSPTDSRAYRSGGQIDLDRAKQGAWTGQDWRGAWFYGSRISDAIAGRTVSKITLQLTRSSSGGWNRKVGARLFQHSSTTPSRRPDLVGDVWVAASLEPSGSATVTLPSSWRDALVSGSATGIAADGSGASDYLIYGPSAGKLKIYF